MAGKHSSSDLLHPLRLALVLPINDGFCRDIIRGVSAVAIEQRIQIRLIDPDYCGHESKNWSIDGIIGALGSPGLQEMSRGWGLPAINVSGRMLTPGMPQVLVDNFAVGALAGRHLLEQFSKTFVYLDLPGVYFASQRGEGFRRVLSDSGRQCHRVAPNRADALEFIKTAPKPVGVFAVNDHMGVELTREALETGLRTPEDIQVVGVDNDKLRCLLSNPPLTSVDCGWDEVGARAARLMVDWQRTGTPPPPRTVMPPAGIVVRQSSDRAMADDDLIAAAMKIIRSQASGRLAVKDLLRRLSVSRRTLEMRFERAMNTSPSAEIVRIQVERACQLLADTDLPLDRVAEASGLGNQRQLRIIFNRQLGTSAAEYRARFRPKN